MRHKFFVLILLTGILMTGCLMIQSPGRSVALAETIAAQNTQEIISQIQQDDVIYLGENHDSAIIHQQQLAIITQLQQNSVDSERQLAIAFEMFQRPFQPLLNRYLAGAINEQQLKEQTEYETRWGFDWEFYAPILRFAKEQQIPLIALNTPGEITRKVAVSGIESLGGSDFRYIPPLTEIKLENESYRQRLEEIYQQHVAEQEGDSTDADNFFAAQILWDETMAEAIALYWLNHPQSQIATLVGKAHIMYDYAIPERVARRINQTDFKQISCLLGEPD
ncbi:MAG: ChaN family lipoprotein [Cyanobacteria bacterium P01_A01_bin.40]